MFNINKQILMRKPYSTMCVRLEVNGVKIYIEITSKTVKWKCQFAFTHQVFEFETNSIDKNFTFFFDTIYKFILLCKRLTQIEKTIVTTGPLVKLFVCQNLLEDVVEAFLLLLIIRTLVDHLLLAEGAALAVAHALVVTVLDDLEGLTLIHGQGGWDSHVEEEDRTTGLWTSWPIKFYCNCTKKLDRF